MRRREFITLFGSTAVAWPLPVRAQQSAMPVIGYLSSLGQAISVRFDAAFRRGLSDIGYFEGQNVSVEYRWITDRYDATSSAKVSRRGRTSRASVFAVFKLITSSKRVGCMTGKSAGLAPRRIRPA
jgi:hypothetical protein